MSEEERILYDRSYLQEKRISIANTDKLSKILIKFENDRAFVSPNPTAFEMVLGIIQKIGHQHLSYDSIASMNYEVYRHMEYHFDYFVMNTKSVFDYVGHLINEVLELGFTGKNIDLSKSEFRNEISKKSLRLGTVINGYQSWIGQITRLRDALEHHKVIPILFLDSKGEYSSVAHFPSSPMSYTELLNFVGSKKRMPETEEVVGFCKKSLENTRDVVEEAFELATSKLSGA